METEIVLSYKGVPERFHAPLRHCCLNFFQERGLEAGIIKNNKKKLKFKVSFENFSDGEVDEMHDEWQRTMNTKRAQLNQEDYNG